MKRAGRLLSDESLISATALFACKTLDFHMKIVFVSQLRDSSHHIRSVMLIQSFLIRPGIDEQHHRRIFHGNEILIAQVPLLLPDRPDCAPASDQALRVICQPQIAGLRIPRICAQRVKAPFSAAWPFLFRLSAADQGADRSLPQ